MGSAEARDRVLVLGDDMRIFLSVVRSLGRTGKEVHAAPFNWRSPALKSRHVAQVHRLPRYSEEPDRWRAWLAELLRHERYSLVIPCCDRATVPLHLHRADFAGERLAIPSPEAMELLFDKEQTRALCEDLGVPVARGFRLPAHPAAEDLAERLGLPLVLKPQRSFWADRLHAPDKVWIADTPAELKSALASISEPTRHLAESFFPGVGVGVSVLADKGTILQAFQHRRLRQGRGGCSSYRISEPVDARLLDACRKICVRLGHTGVCMFEFRRNDADGSWILLETNARFWGSMALPVALGVDFPRFLFDLLVHGVSHPPAPYPAGMRSRNLVLDGKNLLAALAGRGEGSRRLAEAADFLLQPVRWATGREKSDSFAADDLAPGVAELATLGRALAEKAARDGGAPPRRRRAERPALVNGAGQA